MAFLALLGGACGPRAIDSPKGPCLDCHDADRRRAKLPDHLVAGFSTDCAACHTQQAWRPARSVPHPGDLPLVGKHGSIGCAACHERKPMPTTCVGCHEKDRARGKDPNHLAPGFLVQCDTCHVPRGWKPAVDHTKFPLRGQHLRLDCTDCHGSGDKAVPSECVGCHDKDRAKPKNPDHLQPGYPTKCENCHLALGWLYTRFNHTPKMPLEQAHAPLTCLDCHKRTPLPRTCVGCHAEDQARAKNPDHMAPGFSQQCAECHSTAAWVPAIKK